MSSNDDLWNQLSQRVSRSQVGGVTAEDDDVLADAEIAEAAINPHRAAQGGQAAAPFPGMMPPMMMGGMGGAGAAGAAGAAPRPPEPAAPPLSVAAQRPAPAGVPGEPIPIQTSPSSGGVGVGGGGGGAGVFPSGDLPESDPPEIPDLGPLGSSGAPIVEAPTPELPDDEPPAEPPVERDSEVGGVSMEAVDPPVQEGEAVAVIDGFVANPDELRTLGDRWADLASRMSQVPAQPEAAMGLFEDAQRPQQMLSQQLNAWRKGAAAEFDRMGELLHVSAAQYAAVDDEGAAQIRHTEGLTS